MDDLENKVKLQWLRNYEAAYGPLRCVSDLVRLGSRAVPDRVINTMRQKLLVRAMNARPSKRN